MSGRRWSRRDDQALAEEIEDQQIAEAILPLVAAALGLDADDLRVAAVRRARPCRHLKCRARRWWKRVRP